MTHELLPPTIPARFTYWKKTTMKPILLAVAGLVLAAVPALAEETCVEVEIGGEKTTDPSCLNQHLQRRTDSVHPTENVAPLDATSSPSVKLGGYNETALKQQYGANYGKSAAPWRPTNLYNRPR